MFGRKTFVEITPEMVIRYTSGKKHPDFQPV
jgi:hypothetical protein